MGRVSAPSQLHAELPESSMDVKAEEGGAGVLDCIHYKRVTASGRPRLWVAAMVTYSYALLIPGPHFWKSPVHLLTNIGWKNRKRKRTR